MQNGGTKSEYKRIKNEFEKIKAKRQADADAGEVSTPSPQDATQQRQQQSPAKRLEQRFSVTHGLLVACFSLFLILHCLGLYLFTSGFLLTRLVLDHKSQCDVPPIQLDTKQALASPETGCWHPKQFDKAVVLIIDALRYDFAVPFQAQHASDQPHHYHDALKVLYETAVASPQNAVLLPFIADPPTTTLQRLKGLTTGTLPTFVDAGSNFAGTEIDEDNLISQLRNASKRVVHLGDDTWHALFPTSFEPDLTHAYDSFNVWDLHTVDNGVNEHLFPLLQTENRDKWDVLIGHYLGVDHAGHRYGPDHPAMAAKLEQMDAVLRQTIDLIDDRTLLVVMGDHGMDAKGDHGGESDDEVEATLWMYSKKSIFGHLEGTSILPPPTAKQDAVAQIDLVPTLALLLGIPIPFNNLGAPIAQAFIGAAGKNLESLARVSRITAAQVSRYIAEYALIRDVEDAFAIPSDLWKSANALHAKIGTGSRSAQQWQDLYSAFRDYQDQTVGVCRALWARFDIPRMMIGGAILATSLVLLIVYARGVYSQRLALSVELLRKGGLGTILGGIAGAVARYTVPGTSMLFASAVLASLGCIIGLAGTLYSARRSIRLPLPTTIWSWSSVIFTLALCAAFGANSFTIWEDEILLFFITSIGVLLFVFSMRLENFTERTWACYHSAVFTILTRVASFSRLCREEQMPYCISTYYASSTSSTSAGWQLIVPFLVAFVLPSIVKQHYINTGSYHHSAILWLGVAFRAILAMSASYWALDAADDRELFGPEFSDTLKTVKVMLAQVILGISIPVGYSLYTWAAPFMQVITRGAASDAAADALVDGQSNVQVLGYQNAYGSRYFILPTMYAAAIGLLQKPMGSGAIAILLWQILCLLEVLSANDLHQSAIGPICLALLGNFHFFKTGHQATLASLQWDTAFIPLKTIVYPWTPLFVIFNTFGGQILTAIAVPAIPLWKRNPMRAGKLAEAAKATATFLSFFAAQALATSACAGWLRRHLMLYRIFMPRFMMGALTLVVVDVVAIFIGLAGTRWTFLSLGEVFGVYS